jgi:hypothetical protein
MPVAEGIAMAAAGAVTAPPGDPGSPKAASPGLVFMIVGRQ